MIERRLNTKAAAAMAAMRQAIASLPNMDRRGFMEA
jgi:hypothetical protein